MFRFAVCFLLGLLCLVGGTTALHAQRARRTAAQPRHTLVQKVEPQASAATQPAASAQPNEVAPAPLANPALIANYKIDAQLSFDDLGRPVNLQGREQLTWKNDSPDTITELQFHLYLNAFKNERSTFFRESGGQLRNDYFTAGEWGWIDVNKIAIVGGEDLTAKREFIHPDNDHAEDQTVMRVPLTTPLKAGETIVLDLDFTARLPRVFARTGYWGKFAMVGQWFPKIGVWEEKGERRRAESGWNCHQFHANTEFYADFGNYDVTLTVPLVYKGKLGATGQQISETINNDGTVRYQFSQSNVHDFAWTVDTNYLVEHRTFKPAEWVKPHELEAVSKRLNLPVEQLQLKEVACTLLIQPEHREQIERHFQAAFNSLKYFGLWYGAYPYDTLTIVDPPYQGDGAGGMEYPTLITGGTNWWMDDGPEPETVIVHEFGHQYFYGLLASNEFEEAWLDEGFNTYAEAQVMNAAYGNTLLPFKALGIPIMNFPVELPHPYEYRLGTFMSEFTDPIAVKAWQYYSADSYALNSYSRTGLMLNTLEAWLGKDTMARVMREYASRWRYRHPTAQDFFDVAKQISGQDLSWFVEQFVQSPKTLDYEIAAYRSSQPPTPKGWFDKDGKKEEITTANPGSREQTGANKSGKPYDCVVTVRRNGDAWFPHEFQITLADGKEIQGKPIAVREQLIEYQFTNTQDNTQWNETWPVNERWKKFRFKANAEITGVRLDPTHKVMLEANMVNNSRTEASALAGATRWTSGALFWVQALLQTFGMIA